MHSVRLITEVRSEIWNVHRYEGIGSPRFWLAKQPRTIWQTVAETSTMVWGKPNDAEAGDEFVAVESGGGFHDREVAGFGRIQAVDGRRWLVQVRLVPRCKPPLLALSPWPSSSRQVLPIPRSFFDRMMKEADTRAPAGS